MRPGSRPRLRVRTLSQPLPRMLSCSARVPRAMGPSLIVTPPSQAGTPALQRTGADHFVGHGLGSLNPGLLGRPLASQRRTSSVVIRGGRKMCDHAARASGGLLPSRGSRPGASLPWSARRHYCARRAALPDGRSGTIERPARPGGAPFSSSFIVRLSGGGGARSWLGRRRRDGQRSRP